MSTTDWDTTSSADALACDGGSDPLPAAEKRVSQLQYSVPSKTPLTFEDVEVCTGSKVLRIAKSFLFDLILPSLDLLSLMFATH
jgi:hypothetical protein